jgi:transposase-like protein/IS1 family transposase
MSLVLSVTLFLWLLALLALLFLFHRHRITSPPTDCTTRQPKIPCQLKPRTPAACAACRVASVAPARPPPAPAAPPTPWSQIKSRRGRPKAIATQGFACPNPACAYYNIADATIHALVGDGCQGQTEPIPTFRCQACHHTFSARRDTPLYRLRTPPARVAQVLTALAEGLDVAATARVFGYRETTICCWLDRAGQHMQRLHTQRLRDLHIGHVQLDEIRTHGRLRERVLWLWVAFDPSSKLIRVMHLGSRTQQAAQHVIHNLLQPLAPGCVPVMSSDGLNLYFYALTAHFGRWVQAVGERRRAWQVRPDLICGQVQKIVRQRKLVRVKQVMLLGSLAEVRLKLQGLGFSGKLNTAFVERVNLTLRRGRAGLARQTWATAQHRRVRWRKPSYGAATTTWCGYMRG